MKGWENRAIRTLGRVVTGKTPSKDIVDFWQGNELFVSPRDMEYDSRYITNTQSKISVKALQKFTGQKIPKNTVMYTALSYGFGKIGIASKQLITNQQINSIIVNKENDFRFVYYLLRLNTPYIFSFNSGIDTPIVPKSVFEKIKLAVPSLLIQRKIAAILSAYDDLIENNNRRIAILEKMAEELYREWFVRLRFPGHEKVKIVKGVPEGWEIKRIGDVVERKHFGRIYREYEVSSEGRTIVIDQSTDDYLGFYDGEPEHKASIEKPIVLFGDHSCKMKLMIESFSLAENVIPFIGKGSFPTIFLFYLIHNSIETIEYKRHWNDLISKEVLIPSIDLKIDFSRILVPHIILKEKFLIANRRLKKCRDILLSRLMSGMIDVETLDIEFPKSMQEETIDA
jgi:type I restriction enzyme S subunit